MFQVLAEEIKEVVENFNEKSAPDLIPKHYFTLIKRLWEDEKAQECYDRRREYQVIL